MKEPDNWLLQKDPDYIVYKLAEGKYWRMEVVRNSYYIDAVRFLSALEKAK